MLPIISLSRLRLLILLLLLEVHLGLLLTWRIKWIMGTLSMTTSIDGLSWARWPLVIVVGCTARTITSICWSSSLLTWPNPICTSWGRLHIMLCFLISLLATFRYVLSIHIIALRVWWMMVVWSAQSVIRSHCLRIVMLMVVVSLSHVHHLITLTIILLVTADKTRNMLLWSTWVTNNLYRTISEGR